MKIINTISEMRSVSNIIKKEGKTIALVPTMGYLHDGHLSLVKGARKKCDFLVATIFVNPAQFAKSEDLDVYPTDLNRDKKLLQNLAVDAIFLPTILEIYPPHFQTYVEVKELSKNLCGEFRPDHFGGVSTVVAKLFNIVDPDIALFGEKDYQQLILIRQMVDDLNFNIEIIGMPIVREKDGLAMSSRNYYLSSDERVIAGSIYRSLKTGKKLFQEGVRNVVEIKKMAQEKIDKEVEIEYLELCDANSLEPLDFIEDKALFAVAAHVGKTRLIDNIILSH